MKIRQYMLSLSIVCPILKSYYCMLYIILGMEDGIFIVVLVYETDE